MNTTPTKKYFVVSLPRTGTKSLCKMAHIMGFKFKHVPSVVLPRLLREDEINFFADTPIFAPSTFSLLAENENFKFIYIDRNKESWIDSFERVDLPGNYMSLHQRKIPENQITTMDRETLEEIFDNNDYSRELALDRYDWHYQKVIDTIPNNRLLIYKFSEGWGSLANFMEVPIPDQEIPKINQNTMFESIL
jgi:hypothetical protein